MIEGPALFIALFVLYALMKPKHQPHGHGNPDEERQRAMRLLAEERDRRSAD